MKQILQRVGIGLLVILIVIQFIHPEKNLSNVQANDITKKYVVPEPVMQILKTSCYDCHSNITAYPWYSKIQPVDWWLTHHINEGKQGLNFNEFSAYSIAKQYKRFADINKLVEEGDMPLSSYTVIHRYAILNEAQKATIKQWTSTERDSIKANYAADSLILPKKPVKK